MSFAFSIFTIKSTHHYKDESDSIIYASNGLDIDFTSSSITTSNSDGNSNGNYITDPKVRSRAIQQAALQTATFLRKEDRYQQLRDKPKHEHMKLMEEQEELKHIQEEEKELQAQEDKYYMYYEDTDDTAATVIGMTYSSDIKLYKRFIGSLRATGFGGQIILGIEESFLTTHADIISYLQEHNVTLQYLHPIECTFSTAKSLQKCYKPYPHIKREWARFPLARDWLSACSTCNGPVIFAFPEQTFFQKNPFGVGMPVVKRLHLYEQHPSVDVSKTSAGVLMKACVDIDLQKEMEGDDPDIDPRGILSAATALGQRDDIIDYLGLVYSIIREWMQRSECHFQHSSSDLGMAIVNFLRVKERLPYKTRIMVHRTGVVNNVDFEGTNAIEAHVHLWKFRGLTTEESEEMPYIDKGLEVSGSGSGSNGNGGWIDTDYLVTDEEGHFIDVFFQTSAVIYGYSSFGKPFLSWLDRHLNITTSDGDGEEEVLGDGHRIVSGSGSVAVSTSVATDSGAVGTGTGTATVLDVDPGVSVPLPLQEDPTQKEIEKEGYYITQKEQEQEQVKNSDVLVERKKEIRLGEGNTMNVHVPADTRANVENNADNEGMYYSKPGSKVTVINGNRDDVGKKDNGSDDEVDAPVAVVPVAETHVKEEDADRTSQKEAEEAVAANIQLEPVDIKVEIPDEKQDDDIA